MTKDDSHTTDVQHKAETVPTGLNSYFALHWSIAVGLAIFMLCFMSTEHHHVGHVSNFNSAYEMIMPSSQCLVENNSVCFAMNDIEEAVAQPVDAPS